MEFTVQYLSFFVIQTAAQGADTDKTFRHYQTLDAFDYADSELKSFLDGEFARICKRKVEKHPQSDVVPTKIGSFIVEPGFELASNPNWALFHRLRTADNKEQFHAYSDEMVRMYMDTSAVRGGAFIVARAKLNKWFDDPFLFIMKCDFEPKIARISDEKHLIAAVEMAISARNIKSIQYPHMPEEGMSEEGELKIHQASHARYFEDFLKFVSYEKSMPEIVTQQVTSMVQQYMEQKWQETYNEEREQEEQSFEVWSASEKRELQEKWSHDQVAAATMQVVEHKPDIELKLKLDDVTVKGRMAAYGDSIHIARFNGKYVVLIEGDSFLFEKNVSPVELLQPPELEELLRELAGRRESN
ncbi:DUF3900 domain-containing protein [Paenibacillus alkalitolerans]|uniref:DUF3900 domain-containing protein n=1 Tax=Paenibacillus alkalitolerans TaxID=2799335 RepID=UPI0018F4D014|nr:DUF3900 domain-containing protein [Paenibacillus alkalitolerans]